MGLIIALLIAGIATSVGLYFVELHVELDGKKEYVLKDGLVKELMAKAVADPDPNSFTVDTESQKIMMGRVIVGKFYTDGFWFPYKVQVLAKEYNQRQTDEDWGYDVGYVTRFSRDYVAIRDLLKKSKTNIEQTQRKKLNLNK
jgi:hypothetical protein